MEYYTKRKQNQKSLPAYLDSVPSTRRAFFVVEDWNSVWQDRNQVVSEKVCTVFPRTCSKPALLFSKSGYVDVLKTTQFIGATQSDSSVAGGPLECTYVTISEFAAELNLLFE
jgi:hypothetical protein